MSIDLANWGLLVTVDQLAAAQWELARRYHQTDQAIKANIFRNRDAEILQGLERRLADGAR